MSEGVREGGREEERQKREGERKRDRREGRREVNWGGSGTGKVCVPLQSWVTG